VGAFDGSLSFTRFEVAGTPPRGFRDKYLEAVKLRAFAPLDPEREDVESAGWCVCGRVLDLAFDHDALFYGAELALGLRVDRWRVPAAVLRAHLETEAKQLLQKKGQDKLGKTQRTELKQRVLTRLRKRSLPSMRLTDLVWNLDTGVLRFWSHSPRSIETLRELFELSFGLELVQDSPWVLSERVLATSRLDALARVTPTIIGKPPRLVVEG
jgi:recombination associated protein RdgC